MSGLVVIYPDVIVFVRGGPASSFLISNTVLDSDEGILNGIRGSAGMEVGRTIGMFPMIMSRSCRKSRPCKGFVKKSAMMMPVGQYSIRTSLDFTQSAMKKYRTLMCLVRLPLDPRPLVSSRMELLLSWYNTLS